MGQRRILVRYKITHQSRNLLVKWLLYFILNEIMAYFVIIKIRSVSVDSQKYLHCPSNFVRKIFTLTDI